MSRKITKPMKLEQTYGGPNVPERLRSRTFHIPADQTPTVISRPWVVEMADEPLRDARGRRVAVRLNYAASVILLDPGLKPAEAAVATATAFGAAFATHDILPIVEPPAAKRQPRRRSARTGRAAAMRIAA